MKALVDCENRPGPGAERISGVTFVAPTVVLLHSTKSPAAAEQRVPSDYCTGDRTLYFSRAAYLRVVTIGRPSRSSSCSTPTVQELVSIFDSSDALAELAAVTTRRRKHIAWRITP